MSDINTLEKELQKQKKEDKAKLKILMKLALEYKKTSLEKSLEYSKQVLKIAEKINDPEELSEITRFIGELKSRMSDFAGSKKYVEMSIKYAKQSNKHKLQISAINELARIYMKQSDYKEMLNCSLEMLAISRKNSDQENIAVSHHNIGIAFRNLGESDKALENYLKTLKIFRNLGDIPKVARVLNSIGIVHETLNDIDKAFQSYQEALKILEEIKDTNFIYQTLNNLGNIFEEKGEYKKALDYYQRALEFEKINNYQQGISLSLNNIGYLYEELGENEKALDYYLESLKIKEKLQYKRGIAQTLNNIASVQTTLMNYREAEKSLKRALKIAEEIDSKINLRDIYYSFYLLYTEERKYRKALDCFIEYTKLTEELQNIDLKERIEKLQIDFEIKQGETETKILKKKNSELQKEIKKRKRVEAALKKNFVQQKLLSEVSYLFTKLGKFKQSMNKALRLIGKHTDVSRVYIFENFNDGKNTKNTFEWCNKGIEPQIDILQDIPYEMYPSWVKILEEKGMIYSTDISEFPKDIYDILAPQNIKSILVFPIYLGNEFFGFMGFDECTKERVWEESEIELLKTTVHEISNLYERRKAEKNLMENEKKYYELYNMIRLMADTVPDMIWAKDLEGKFTFTNKAICKYLLNTKNTDEPIDKTDMFFAIRERKKHPENKKWHNFGEICVNSDKVVLENKKPQRFDEFGNVQGKFLFLDVYKAPIFDDIGEMIGTVGSARDVTREKEIEKILKNERNYYHSFVESLTDWVWEMDLNGIHTYSNKAVEKVLGYKSGEIIGKHVSEFWPEPPEMDIERFNKDLLAGKGWKNYTGRFIHKNGSLVFAESSAIPIYDSNHKLAGYRGVDRDITARKEIEDALKKSEEKYKLLADHSSDVISLWWNNKLVYISPAVEKNSGFGYKDFIDNYENFLHPDDLKKHFEKVKNNTLNKIEHTTFIERYLHKDRSYHWYETNFKNEYKEDGTVISIGVSRDITDRKEIEEKIIQTKKEWEQTFDSVSDIIMLVNNNNKIVRVNKAFSENIGIASHKIIGCDCDDFYNRIYKSTSKLPTKVVLKDGKERTEVMFDKNSNKYYLNSVTPLIDNKRIWGVVSISKDITAIKNTEEELKHHQEHIELINKILRHDLTNNLAVIKSAINIYKNERAEGLLDEASNRVFSSVQLIRKMKNLESVISSDRQLSPINIKKVMRKVLSDYRAIEFNVSGKASVMADDALYSVFNNIIQNAVDHGKASRIDIKIKEKPENFEIRIEDNGVGIPDEIKKSIFEEGFKFGEKGHTGLGLFIVKNAVKNYGGNIKVEDNIPNGTVFILDLKKG